MMLKQLNSGIVIDVSNTDNMYDLFTLDQLEIIEAIIYFKDTDLLNLKEELGDVQYYLKNIENNISDLRKYVNRYGLKNEKKVIEKIDNIYGGI